MSKIFVSIACFMDNDIINTIEDCLDKAKYPENIIFGICYQCEDNDNLLEKYENKENFRIIKMNWKEAKGPTYARFLCSTLIKDEDYFMQIDCHSRFYKNWDNDIIKCYQKIDDNKKILTMFPIPIKYMDNENYPKNISTPTFQEISLNNIKLGSVTCSKQCVKTYYLSAAFIFGNIKFLKEVPLDPYLLYSYQKIEQQFYAIRLYTAGWNLYVPDKHYIGTNYEKSKHFDSNFNRIFPPSNNYLGNKSWERVLYYYGLKKENELDSLFSKNLDKYGLGKERTLESFFNIHSIYNFKEKIRNNFIYKKKQWIKNKYTFKSTNSLLKEILSNNSFFSKISDNPDFEWNIHTKNDDKLLQHYKMSNVAIIDNKYSISKLLISNNLINLIPKTYLNINELSNFNDNNYFLKYAGNNGGKNVFIYNNKIELDNHILTDNRKYIIQEEVQNMYLLNGHKFVLRNWLVLINNNFYLSKDGCCIIHEKEYSKNNLDRKVHIEHDISKIKYENFISLPTYNNLFKNVLNNITHISKVIKNNINLKTNCYQVFGLDYIFDNNFNSYLIEINSWPNMSVPYGKYKDILNNFFSNFIEELVLPTLKNDTIQTKYFESL